MARTWVAKEFDRLFNKFICTDELWPGSRTYHLRYRSRYKACLERFAAKAPNHPIDVLDVGCGQLAIMCKKMWNDRAVMTDLPGSNFSYMTAHGVETVTWNLCAAESQFNRRFSAVFFSEVIEHLPIPGYIALARLRRTMRPGGIIICTTPNLYRLRNVVYLALGLPIFDNFRMPDGESSLSHVLEYSGDHLRWQFEKAGFVLCRLEFVQLHHWPTNPLHRPLAWLGYPLHILPRWRDNLIMTATAPGE